MAASGLSCVEAANLSEALWLVACGQALQFLGQRGPARNCLHSHLTAESVATGADPEPKCSSHSAVLLLSQHGLQMLKLILSPEMHSRFFNAQLCVTILTSASYGMVETDVEGIASHSRPETVAIHGASHLSKVRQVMGEPFAGLSDHCWQSLIRGSLTQLFLWSLIWSLSGVLFSQPMDLMVEYVAANSRNLRAIVEGITFRSAFCRPGAKRLSPTSCSGPGCCLAEQEQ